MILGMNNYLREEMKSTEGQLLPYIAGFVGGVYASGVVI